MLKEKEKFYLTLILILVIGALLVWRGIINGQVIVDSNIEAIQDKKITIGAYDLRGVELPHALDSYSSAKKEIDKLDPLFVDDKNLPVFINDLEVVANITSNSLEKVFIDDPDAMPQKGSSKSNTSKASPTPTPKPKEGDAYALRLTLNGNYKQLMNFVSKLESMHYYIYIRSISINTKVESSSGPAAGKKKQSSGENLQTTMIIKVFKKQDFNGKK